MKYILSSIDVPGLEFGEIELAPFEHWKSSSYWVPFLLNGIHVYDIIAPTFFRVLAASTAQALFFMVLLLSFSFPLSLGMETPILWGHALLITRIILFMILFLVTIKMLLLLPLLKTKLTMPQPGSTSGTPLELFLAKRIGQLYPELVGEQVQVSQPGEDHTFTLWVKAPNQ